MSGPSATADKAVNVQPGGLLSAASTVVTHVERSAAPPAATPISKPGSSVDAAAGTVTAGMQTKMAASNAGIAVKTMTNEPRWHSSPLPAA